MSIENNLTENCTREGLRAIWASNIKAQKSGNLHEACHKLIKKVCHDLLKGVAGWLGYDQNKSEECYNDFLYFLWTLSENEKQSGKESETLTKALTSHWALKNKFLDHRKNSMADRKPGTLSKTNSLSSSGEWNPDEYLDRINGRKQYYRKRFLDILREKKRIVEIEKRKIVGRSKGDYFFTYASIKLSHLEMSQFQEHLGKLAASFNPTLSDNDFWSGEDTIHYPDGSEGRYEGPGAKQLDQFCEQLFQHVAETFGHEYLISLNMVMDILPQIYTFFQEKQRLSLSVSSKDGDDSQGEISEEIIPASDVDFEKKLAHHSAEKKEDIIRAIVRGLNPETGIILCAVSEGKIYKEIANLIGQKSPTRIGEKIRRAYEELIKVSQKAGLWSDDGDMENKCISSIIFKVIEEEWKKVTENAGKTSNVLQEVSR